MQKKAHCTPSFLQPNPDIGPSDYMPIQASILFDIEYLKYQGQVYKYIDWYYYLLYVFVQQKLIGTRSQSSSVISHKKPLKSKQIRLTSEQIRILKDTFVNNPYPSRKTKEYLAQITKLPMRKVQNWFSYARSKQRKALKIKK